MPYYHRVLKLSQRQIEYVNKFNNNPKIKFEKISCLNCSSANKKILFTNEEHGFDQNTVLCKNCGLIYLNPRMTKNSSDFFYNSDLFCNIYAFCVDSLPAPETSFKNEQVSYEQVNSSFERKGRLVKSKTFYRYDYGKRPFHETINSLNLQYQSVCDIGAGDGSTLKTFQLAGKDVWGYEPSKLLCNLAKTKGVNLINGFIDDVKGEYDLVIMIHVFEHLLNPIDALKKLRKHIKRYLFIEVPVSINKLQTIKNIHNCYFSLNTLSQVVTKCGFKRIYYEYKLSRFNDTISALFEKSDKTEIYYYNYAHEVKKYTRIYYKYYIKYFIKRVLRKILRKINPNFEKKIVNIIDLRGS